MIMYYREISKIDQDYALEMPEPPSLRTEGTEESITDSNVRNSKRFNLK
jgi:hypothetical protein